MPYTITRIGNRWIVRKRWQPFGHVYGTHDTKTQAEAQVRAIEANEHRR